MKKLILSGLFLFSISNYAQNTAIPDPKFEQALINLGIDSGPINGSVKTSSISSLTSLSLPPNYDGDANAITDLTGIEGFTSLTSLYCDYQKLTRLNVSANTKLTTLICNDNLLTALDITKNTLLVNLNFDNNQITNIDISKNTALDSFSANFNLLTSLDLSKNTNLTGLYCSYNQLTSLNTSANQKLKWLQCALNQIPSLNISANTNLLSLIVSANLLTDLSIEKNLLLENLEIDSNQITTMDISKHTALKHYSCSINPLKTLDVSKNVNLTKLYCNYNQLTTLDLSTLVKLTFLHAIGNDLKNVNLKNGKNMLITPYDPDFSDNPNLTCIQVDDVAYANSNWTYKPSTAVYSASCPALGLKDIAFNTVSIYPNPAKGELHIDNITLEQATIYDALGHKIKTVSFDSTITNNTIELLNYSKGMYYLYLQSQGETTVKKIMIE